MDSVTIIVQKGKYMKSLTLIAVAFGLALPCSSHAAHWTAGMKEGKLELKSAGPIAFGPEGILFIADTKAAAIAAVATGDTKTVAASKLTKVEGINQKIAGLLGTAADQILIDDLAVNPISRNV